MGAKIGRVAFEFAQRLVLRECHTLNAIELLNPMPTLIQQYGRSWHNVDWKSLGIVDKMTVKMQLAVLYYWLQSTRACGVSGEDRIKYIEGVGKDKLTGFGTAHFRLLRPRLESFFTVGTAEIISGGNLVKTKLKEAQYLATVFSVRYAHSENGKNHRLPGRNYFATFKNADGLFVFDSERGETSVGLNLGEIEYDQIFYKPGLHVAGATIWPLTPKPIIAATSGNPTPQSAATATASQSHASCEPPLPDDLVFWDLGGSNFADFDINSDGAALDPPSAKRPRLA